MRYFLLLNLLLFGALHAVEVNELPGSIGVEIIGLDLKNPLTDDQIEMIQSLLEERLVVVVRNQDLSAKEQVAFSSQLGDLEIAWDKTDRHPDTPYVHVITNESLQKNPDFKSSTFSWHWDKSFLDYPTNISIAYFNAEPQPEGYGETEFVNLYLAYDALAEDEKLQLEGLQAIHSYEHMRKQRRRNYEKAHLNLKHQPSDFPDVYHPMIREHPVTSKRVLNLDELSQSGIVGMSHQEWRLLQKRLIAHATQPQFFYSHVWQKGDLILWDNLALMHRATPSNPAVFRTLHRTNTNSRSLMEGRAIVIGAEELPANFDAAQLFALPLVMRSDLYSDMESLAADLEKLRRGKSIDGVPPHALILVVGKAWKQSPQVWSQIDFVSNRPDYIEEFCYQKFSKQDWHERKVCGELSREHLNRKLGLLVTSMETYFSDVTPAVIRDQRLRVHAKVLADAFSRTSIAKSEEEWFEWICNPPKLTPAKNRPWFLFFGGAQGVGRTTMVKELESDGMIDDQCVVINTRIFFDYLQHKIPYLHKIKMWPVIHKEKLHLVKQITDIALSHGLNVAIDTYLLEADEGVAIIESAKALGADTTMVAIATPLHEAYLRKWRLARNKAHYQERTYEIFMFHKLFAQLFPVFAEHFDTTLVIDPQKNLNDIAYFSAPGRCDIVKEESFCRFLSEASIDPDDLAFKVGLSHHAEALIERELKAVVQR